MIHPPFSIFTAIVPPCRYAPKPPEEFHSCERCPVPDIVGSPRGPARPYFMSLPAKRNSYVLCGSLPPMVFSGDALAPLLEGEASPISILNCLTSSADCI